MAFISSAVTEIVRIAHVAGLVGKRVVRLVPLEGSTVVLEDFGDVHPQWRTGGGVSEAKIGIRLGRARIHPIR